MPKQIFQRPAPINHQKIGKPHGPAAQPDWGRKKTPKIPAEEQNPLIKKLKETQ